MSTANLIVGYSKLSVGKHFLLLLEGVNLTIYSQLLYWLQENWLILLIKAFRINEDSFCDCSSFSGIDHPLWGLTEELPQLSYVRHNSNHLFKRHSYSSEQVLCTAERKIHRLTLKKPLATQTETVGCSQPYIQTHSDLSLHRIPGSQNGWGWLTPYSWAILMSYMTRLNDFHLEHFFLSGSL